ncbi:dermatopontin-like [Physella acuta]|uniref:dermatopontin-like n=1 Tax=Physella acuta TaxID=109671 RepID=UPI0027DAEFC5|nr:dermatopontin-like [Physella acuta]
MDLASRLRFLVYCSVASSVSGMFINDWDKSFDFKCPAGQAVSYIASEHNNFYEDRRWEFACRDVGATEQCVDSGYVNEFDLPVAFTCPGTSVLTGVSSYNDNHYEDRRFRFQCCSVPRGAPGDCHVTAELNKFDEKLTLQVPEGQVIRSVLSNHDNHYEDRVWKFELCKLKKTGCRK